MTDNVPEPAREPGLLRASDADRSIVMDLLSVAYSEGRLTKDELDERISMAMGARTFQDLVPLTTDLVPSGNPGHFVGALTQPSSGPSIERRGDASIDTTVALFGAAERRGRWHARRRITALTLFGGTKFDFREATFEDSVCEISNLCMFGGVEVDVPDGVNVRNETIAVFGGTEVKHLAPPDPTRPTIVLKGLVLFGGVEARGDKRRNRR